MGLDPNHKRATGLGARAKRVALDSLASQPRQDKAPARKKSGKKGIKCGRGWISPDKDCAPRKSRRLKQEFDPEGEFLNPAIGLFGTAALGTGIAGAVLLGGFGGGRGGSTSAQAPSSPSFPIGPDPQPPQAQSPPVQNTQDPSPETPPAQNIQGPSPQPSPVQSTQRPSPPGDVSRAPQGRKIDLFPRGIDRGSYDDYPGREVGDHPDTARVVKRIEDEIRDKSHRWLVAVDAKTGKEVFRITDWNPTDVSGNNHPREMEILRASKGDLIDRKSVV